MTAPRMSLAAIRNEIGARLRATRKNTELSLAKIEEAFRQRTGDELKSVTIGSYERGARSPSAAILWVLAQFYKVPIQDLYPDSNAETPRDVVAVPVSDAVLDVLEEFVKAGRMRQQMRDASIHAAAEDEAA